ncbi:uncharacterized protein LOC131878372 [Tigriopus californicus]|uniref:uncharacterized protein LOC131878372 n=1 Tax=Tigriopus californicus TaxID=6832 RepID=UPI0027D9D4E9|nr:uncharacterized protein LOC131878372 [Tigriopus californicus]XP_059080306.1 uncharacterized protein LOC131878372 [Tigriopus californicus]
MGFTELIEDLETGIISACTRRVGASETTQFVFQDDPMSPQDDAPLVSQGDSNQSEMDIDGIMAQLQFPSGILGSFSDSQNDPVDYESQSQDNVANEDYYTDLTDESTTLSPVTNTLRPLGSTTTSISQTANSGCSKKMTVVERNEWIPDWVAPLRLDSVTGVRMYVFYAKLPITAQEEDGLLVRLMSRGRLGRNAYFIKILKNRNVSIGRSFLDSESIETENVRVTESSTSVRWLSSQEYIGFWALHVNGYTSVGVIDAHFPDKPLVSWQDEDPFSGIDTIGLSAIGSAAFYELDCDFIFSSPGGICAQNQDCDNLANTDCLNERIDRDVVIRTCQCRSGNIQIPDIQRSFVGGCFDPIGQTKTLNGMCLADLHCSGLAYSYCLKLNQSATQGLCVCNPGFVPMERSNENGLILGCRPRSAGDSRVELENCAMNLTLLERQDWIPMNLLPFRASEESNEFKDYFYIRFAESSGSIASIKLLNQRQDPTKFYKITITDGNRISLFENLQSSTFLFEARNEQIIRNSTLFTPPPATFLGFWTLYRANSGLLEAGIIGQSLPVVTWTDRASDRMQDISWIGFETERGGPIEFASNC